MLGKIKIADVQVSVPGGLWVGTVKLPVLALDLAAVSV